ncbi:MAG: outer membrane lipoprotein carrier protein LolA [Reyranellaceae bacterium]
MTSLSRRSLLGVLLALALTLALPLPAQAQPLNERDRADIARIEKYMNAITTLRAKFVQTEEDGRQLEGVLHLQRPGKLRFQFVPKGPYEIIADGTQLNYIGGGALTQVSLDATPLSVLVAENIRFDDRLQITGIEREPGFIAVNLVQRKNPDGEKLQIVFSDKPLQLKRWAITYKSGRTVAVGLFDVETGVAIDPKTFVYSNPHIQQRQTY